MPSQGPRARGSGREWDHQDCWDGQVGAKQDGQVGDVSVFRFAARYELAFYSLVRYLYCTRRTDRTDGSIRITEIDHLHCWPLFPRHTKRNQRIPHPGRGARGGV